tara:strand:- start:286 stop:405 length:120 start_codon:yes stop_codon:yes gene_type:complete
MGIWESESFSRIKESVLCSWRVSSLVDALPITENSAFKF